MMGVDEPDYGHLLDEMQVFEDAPVEPPRYCTRGSRSRSASSSARICPARAAPRPTCWPRPVRSRPSIELIDTRIADWKIKLSDTIADNASRPAACSGSRAGRADQAWTSRRSTRVLTRNGELVAEGRSDAVLGNPVTAVAWLARKVASFGVRWRRATWSCPARAPARSTPVPATPSTPSSTGSVPSVCTFE